uniref:SCAN box domain-containing protein n=1 Tax=Pseudonaja textilis TaxID=8673 RepID=A0A670Z776_PSETE
GRGESPSAVQLGSCEEIWASARQKVLEEETILRSGVQSWDFRSFQYLEAEGPRGLRNRFHQLYHKWLQPERNTKAQMLDLVVLKLPHEPGQREATGKSAGRYLLRS